MITIIVEMIVGIQKTEVVLPINKMGIVIGKLRGQYEKGWMMM